LLQGFQVSELLSVQALKKDGIIWQGVQPLQRARLSNIIFVKVDDQRLVMELFGLAGVTSTCNCRSRVKFAYVACYIWNVLTAIDAFGGKVHSG
jgi:hypothetical protein